MPIHKAGGTISSYIRCRYSKTQTVQVHGRMRGLVLSKGPVFTLSRFNPPPNWPRFPEGWVPPEGWEPHPSWGVVPPGWQLWVPSVDQSRSSESSKNLPDYGSTPRKQQKSRRFGAYSSIITAGSITLSTAVVAFATLGNGVDEILSPEYVQALDTLSFWNGHNKTVDFSNTATWPAHTLYQNYSEVGSNSPTITSTQELSGTGEALLDLSRPDGPVEPAWVEYEITPSDTNDPEVTFLGGSQEQFINVIASANKQEEPVKGSIWLDTNVSKSSQKVQVSTRGEWKITVHPVSDAPLYDSISQLAGTGQQAFILQQIQGAHLIYAPQSEVSAQSLSPFSVTVPDQLGREDIQPTQVFTSALPAQDTDFKIPSSPWFVTVDGQGYDWWIGFNHEAISPIGALNAQPYKFPHDGGQEIAASDRSQIFTLENTNPVILTYTTTPTEQTERRKRYQKYGPEAIDFSEAQKFAVTNPDKDLDEPGAIRAKEFGHDGTVYDLVNMTPDPVNRLEVLTQNQESWQVKAYPLDAAPEIKPGDAFYGRRGDGAGVFFWSGGTEAKLEFYREVQVSWGVEEASITFYRPDGTGHYRSQTVFASDLSSTKISVDLPAEPLYIDVRTPLASSWSVYVPQ